MPFVILLTIAVVVLICGFAIQAGDWTLQMAGIWILANIVLHGLLILVWSASPTLHLIDDGIYATGLLPLAFFSVSPWIGALAFLACGSFILQSVYLLGDLKIDTIFVVINNVVTIGCLLTLFSGAMAGVLARRRARRADDMAGLAAA